MQKIINEEVDKMIEKDVIEPSNSPWSSPVVLVKKKNKKYRFCIDFRKINEVSEKDAYPLPQVNATLDKLRNVKYISTIDLENGYWQVPLDEKSKPITAFTVPGRGLFQFKVMPFGLHSASATFQRFLNTIIGPDLEPFVFVYLDDIIVIGRTLTEHMEKLREVFKRLRESQLKINTEKSKFLETRLVYLGHVVDNYGIHTDVEKVRAIDELKTPTNIKEVRQFIGMVSWYRRFIPNCSELTKPLTFLLQKKKKWRWGDKEQDAYDQLKVKLKTAPVLAPPDFEKPFTLQTDASNEGLGAVLTQERGGQEHVIAYASRSLNKSEINYTVTEKECLAVVWGIQKMRPYLEGYSFNVITDHQSLKWLTTLESPTGRVARWSLYLQQFDFKVLYRKGKLNKVADALSRNNKIRHEEEENDDMQEMIVVASTEIKEGWYNRVKTGVLKSPRQYPEFCIKNGNLYHHMHHSLNYAERSDAWKLCVPENLRDRVMYENHNEPTAGHLGITKTIARIARTYYWPRMYQDIGKYVRSCGKCQEFKPIQQKTPGKMGTVNVTRPWEVVSIDIIGPKPRSSSGMCYVVVMQDKFTKWVETQPLRQAKAEAIVKALREKVLLRFGPVRTVISDNGSQFTSKEFTKLLSDYGVEHFRTPPYSPQCNPMERMNKVIGTMIAQFIRKNQRSWDKLLPELTFAINTAKHESTQFTPAYLNYGREILPPNTLRDQLKKGQPINEYNHAENLKSLADAIELVRVNLAKAFTKQSQYYNAKHSDWTPTIGMKVAKREHYLSSAADKFSAKLANKYSGGYTVTKIISPKVVQVSCGRETQVAHIKDLKPVTNREIPVIILDSLN